MEQLLDDVLVMVMQFLDVEDVFACRLVCKRLCGLALHPDVWRHRSLSDDEPYASAVLHLAPCLDTLIVTSQVSTLAVTTTRCAVASLILQTTHTVATDKKAEIATAYAFAVYKQESLGRLRHLELCRLNNLCVPVTGLLRTIASCSDLKWLDVIGEPPDCGTHRVVHGPSRSSLTYFRCSLGESSASFVHTILAGHAATLEYVIIDASSDFVTQEAPTAALLAAMPRLQRLKCEDTLWGLETVAECNTLRHVHICLIWSFEDREERDRVRKFLRRSKQLRSVHLEKVLGYDNYYTVEDEAVLVEALASSGRSNLEQLILQGFEDVRPVFRALPSLSNLRYLCVSAELDDEMLLSITPVTAPALETLDLRYMEECVHAWIHRGAVEATLAANTSLHIQISIRTDDKCDPLGCKACAGGCHPEVKWVEEVVSIGLFSHDPARCPSCPSLDAHTGEIEITWIRM